MKDEVVEEAEVREEVVVGLKVEEEEVKEEEVVVVEEEMELEELLLPVLVVPLTITVTPVDVILARVRLVILIQREGLVVDVVEVVDDSMMVVDVVVDEFRSVLELEREEGRVKSNKGGVR